MRPSFLTNQRGNMSGGQTGSLVGMALGAAAVLLAPPTGGASLAVWGAAIALGATVGGLAGSLYDTMTADDLVNEQPSLADLKLQTSSFGKVIPQLWGTQRLAGNVFWATDKVEHQRRIDQSGGKGGGPAQVSIEKTYSVSWAIGLTDTRMTGPMQDILRAWRDTTLCIDRSQSGDQGIGTFTIDEAGEGYAIGDLGGVGGGNNDASYEITAVNLDGSIVGLTITVPGSGYVITLSDDDPLHLHRSTGVGNDASIRVVSVIGNSLPANWTFYRGTADQLPDPTIEADKGVGNVPGFRYRSYVVITDDDLGRSGRSFNYTFKLSQADGGAQLIDVVAAYCIAAGLDGKIDLADLPDGRVNQALVSVEALRAPLEHLAQMFRFYVVESGVMLKFRQRGSGGVVATIPADALDAGEHHHGDAGLRITRKQQLEMPTQLTLTYIEPEQNYQQSVQRAQRYLSPTAIENARAISTPLALEAARARQTVQEMLQDAWLQREPIATTLPRAYAYLEPGDRIVVSARELAYAIVLTETTYGQPGLLEIQARTDTAWIVDAPGASPGLATATRPTLVDVDDTLVYLLNLPALHASDTTPRYHAAYDGLNSPWPGATLWRSVDAEATYQQVDSATVEAWTGVVADAMADADPHVLDVHTTITVILDQGTLTGVSDLALYNGANLASLGEEVFAFGMAELVAPQTYELSRLLRGRRGTEDKTGSHVDDERFFLLDAAVRPVSMTLGDRDITRDYKSPTSGQTLSDAYHTTFAPTAENMNAFSVAYPEAVQDGADWQLTWNYRSRFDGELIDFAEIGWDGDFLAFRVIIYDDNTYTTAVRSELTDGGGLASPLDPEAVKEYVYTEAAQIVDFGSAQSTVYYRIFTVNTNGVSRAEELVAA